MGIIVARRLLLMVPTVVGVTLLVFLLVALSPGGVSASLGEADVTTGGGAEARAYFEDRYGLGEPVLTQYARWLGRISPLRFGAPDRVLLDGEVVRVPRPVPHPPLEEWFAAEAPPMGAMVSSQPPTADQCARFDSEAAQARAATVVASARLRGALAEYARAANLPDAIGLSGDVRIGVLARHQPDRRLPAWAVVEQRGAEAVRAYASAERSRAALVQAMNSGVLPAAGAVLIPGALSLAAPDLGRSVHGRSVGSLIAEALPVTLLLNILAIPIIYILAVPCGVLAAARRGGWFDRLTSLAVLSLWSIPTAWSGTLAIGYLCSRRHLGWFPVSGLHSGDADLMAFLPRFEGEFEPGWALDTLWHTALPVACLVYTGLAVLTKQTRAAMLESLHAEYIRTARAKGVPERAVVLRHALRNSLLPLITMFVQVFPAMLAGSVVIERIFSIPGMGTLLLTAIQERDREVILANTLIIAAVNIGALLLADVLYASADPRVRCA